MAEQTVERPLREIMAGSELSETGFELIEGTAFAGPRAVEELRRLLRSWEAEDVDGAFRSKTEATIVRGYCHYLNGELERAEEVFRSVKGEPWGTYWLTRVLLDLRQRAKAVDSARKLRERHPDFAPGRGVAVEAFIAGGLDGEAEALLGTASARERTSANHYYLQGQLAEWRGAYEDAMDCYSKAADVDPRHCRALFRLGYLSGLYGDEQEARACYEACVRLTPVHVNALINLGVLYEDIEKYDDAVRCYRAVLESFPNHPRAKLYLADSRASTSQFYDRDREKELARQNQVLSIPISDFELTVRSRNCLAKMNIETLGDLILKTEAELLSYKNFGDTSLMEVKSILAQKGLRLGEPLPERGRAEKKEFEELEKGVDPEVLSRPIESLNLSIRSRRCMERLKVRTVRDLIHKSEVELMAAKNFGVTSLTEVKQKLAELNLKLRA